MVGTRICVFRNNKGEYWVAVYYSFRNCYSWSRHQTTKQRADRLHDLHWKLVRAGWSCLPMLVGTSIGWGVSPNKLQNIVQWGTLR